MDLSNIPDKELKAELHKREKIQQDKRLAAKQDLIDFIKRSKTINDCLKEAFNISEIKNISFEQGQTFSKDIDYLSLVIEYRV